MAKKATGDEAATVTPITNTNTDSKIINGNVQRTATFRTRFKEDTKGYGWDPAEIQRQLRDKEKA